MFKDLFELIQQHEPHNVHLSNFIKEFIMAKYDELNAKLDELKAAVDAIPLPVAPEDDSADVSALESKVDGMVADAKAKSADPTAPVDPNAPVKTSLSPDGVLQEHGPDGQPLVIDTTKVVG